MAGGQLLLSRGLTVYMKTLSRSFKTFIAPTYCEKTPHSLWEQVVWEQGPPVTYVCCGYVSSMGFLSRLRAMAVIRHFPGIFS